MVKETASPSTAEAMIMSVETPSRLLPPGLLGLSPLPLLLLQAARASTATSAVNDRKNFMLCTSL